MTPQPLYSPRDQNPAYQLRYTWCGWPSAGIFPVLPDEAWPALNAAWKTDGLHLLEREIHDDRILLTFSTTPEVTPVHLAARAKGRLQHAFRNVSGQSIHFSRKVSVRSVGDNTAELVQRYIQSQINSAEFVDPTFAEFLRQFTVVGDFVDLSQPTESNSGRYWYNLHLVLVTEGRHRFIDEPALGVLRDGSFKIAAKKGYRIATLRNARSPACRAAWRD